MGKVVFFDLDGTIVDSTNTICPSAIRAIKALRANGHKTGVATGRSGFEMASFMKRYAVDLFDIVLYNNGAQCEYNGDVLFRKCADPTEIAAIIQIARKNGIEYGTGSAYDWRFSVDYHPAMEKVINGHFLEIPNRCDPDYHIGREIFQGVLFTDLNTALRLCEPVLQQCEIVQGIMIGGGISPHVDFWRRDLTKADGIREVLGLLGSTMEDCYAFGDGFNDIDMLKQAGMGVAMGNADPEVQKYADFVTKSIDEDGVEYALKHFGLI